MNLLATIRNFIVTAAKKHYSLTDTDFRNLEFKINTGDSAQFGDLSTNIAMILTKVVGLNPRVIAGDMQEALTTTHEMREYVASTHIAGPGFLNLTLSPVAMEQLFFELMHEKEAFFVLGEHEQKKKALIEFVSANPTGPLHLGHGRGGIVGDTLARVMTFLGHQVDKEFYINDAGNQIKILGQSFKARCLQQLGQSCELPEEGYGGEYLVDIAADCVAEHGASVAEKPDVFFELYAKEQLLLLIRADLATYRITFDRWFSEKTLHDDGSVEKALQLLQAKDLAYEEEGALWFKSTAFGDDKDRVMRKSSGELTYIAADIAYHKNKFDRGYDVLIDILGHDHHGYVKRLKATMEALSYNPEQLQVILYQLVSIKENDVAVRMSKRAGNFTKLSDVIEEVGADVARFFYLNRKTDMPLDFDIATALKKTDENPVYYIQYAFVRIASLLEKATHEGFDDFVDQCRQGTVAKADLHALMPHFGADDRDLLKKMAILNDILRTIVSSHQTHILSYYALELAQQLHAYYTRNKIIDTKQPGLSKFRMLMVASVQKTLGLCLDLLGVSKPERM
jgi:arginyl-tRNA synthetase